MLVFVGLALFASFALGTVILDVAGFECSIFTGVFNDVGVFVVVLEALVVDVDVVVGGTETFLGLGILEGGIVVLLSV